MGSTEEYRRLVQRCLEIASTVGNADTRATLIQLAQMWLRLAEELEAWGPPLAIDESWPVTQQQQQIQPKGDDEEG